ncbi:hypothetical protein Landi51_08723 [Colletotrichum acutatum]
MGSLPVPAVLAEYMSTSQITPSIRLPTSGGLLSVTDSTSEDVAPRCIKHRIAVRPAKPPVKRLLRKGPLLGSWSRPIILDDVSGPDGCKDSPIVIEADPEYDGSISKPIELEDDPGDDGSRSNPIVILDDPVHEPDQDSFSAAE